MVYENDDQWEKEFKKITPVSLREWPIVVYSQYIDSIQRVEVEFYNLQKQKIHSETLYPTELKDMKSAPFKTNIVSDYYPMKVIFRAIKDDKEFHSWERDLKPNIHWF